MSTNDPKTGQHRGDPPAVAHGLPPLPSELQLLFRYLEPVFLRIAMGLEGHTAALFAIRDLRASDNLDASKWRKRVEELIAAHGLEIAGAAIAVREATSKIVTTKPVALPDDLPEEVHIIVQGTARVAWKHRKAMLVAATTSAAAAWAYVSPWLWEAFKLWKDSL